MSNQRDRVPPEIKQRLRKEAGFGCCVCGHPIIQYHHITPYSIRPNHIPEDMMVFCPNHHDQATANAFPEQEQRQWKMEPYNLKSENLSSAGRIHVFSGKRDIILGGNHFQNNGPLIVVDDEPLISTIYEDGILLLSLQLYDEEDNLLASLNENEWSADPSAVWDLEAGYQKLKIRQKKRSILLELAVVDERIEITGQLWRKGQKIQLSPNSLRIDGVVKNAKFINCHFQNRPIRIDLCTGIISI